MVASMMRFCIPIAPRNGASQFVIAAILPVIQIYLTAIKSLLI
jgi:hypothetical protein